MNIVDLLGILPYFMSLVLQLVTTEDSLVRARFLNDDLTNRQIHQNQQIHQIQIYDKYRICTVYLVWFL